MKARLSLLLGYYADMLFRRYETEFVKIIDFLIMSLSFNGDQKVVAL